MVIDHAAIRASTKHLRNEWTLYPIASNGVNGFQEDLALIQNLLGSCLYETKLAEGAYYIRRLS